MKRGAQSCSTEPRIAIVGLGGLFPGAANLRQFWTNVAGGVDTSRDVPPGRWFLSPKDVLAPGIAVPDHVHTSRAYYLDEIPAPPIERLTALDPLFHLILHAGHQAFAEATTPHLDRSRVGVILGHIALPTEKASALAIETLGQTIAEELGIPSIPTATHPLNRFVAGLPAGVLAHSLGLGGGWYTLDAACASSLYALKLAADELRAGRADLMLTGGAARPDCLYTQMGFAQLRALSPSGKCSPFDAAGDGLVVGEGCGILALKRLDDALRDGNTIHGVIAGIGLSNDVEGSLLAPASEGQLRAMRDAYRQAGWSPADVDLIECHATGTPVGDAVEFTSLWSLWREERWSPGQCVIGSVKSTVGHLLTGAGSAGLIKVLMAMRHGVRPPTANFSMPSRQIGLERSPFRVLREAEPWARRDDATPRHAAVSGFGFGGINAHVLIEEYLPQSTPASVVVPQRPHAEPIAAVGLEARFGPWSSLRAFRDRVLGMSTAEPAAKQNCWGVKHGASFRGYFIDELEVPLDQFRIPPKELEEMLPQQLLMLQVATAALDDARNWEQHRGRAGVFLGLGLDLNTTNFHFRWWALEAGRIWRRRQAGEIDAREFNQWLDELRDAAHPALNANRTMGALGSIAASRIARAFQFGGPSFTICSEESSGGSALAAAVRALQQGELDLAVTGAIDLAGDIRMLVAGDSTQELGEGAAACVLKRLADAERDGDRIYAVIRGVGAASAADEQLQPVDSVTSEALQRAVTGTGIEPHAIDLVESADSVAAQVGRCGAASFAASFVRACLALHHEIRPESANSSRQFWLTNSEDGPRRAAISASGTGGNCVVAVLEEYRSGKVAAAPSAIADNAELLFALEADTPFGLSEEVDRLERVAQCESLTQAAHRWRASAPRRPEAMLGAAIISRSTGELRDQITLLRRHLAERPDAPLTLGPNERIAYTPRPLGRQGKVAFVFPGSGNHFSGMGRELGLRWPQILRRQQCESRRLRDQFAPQQFWDGATVATDPIHALFGQVTLGCLVSDLLQSFGVRPRAAIGNSLGESAALFALRAWTDRDEMLRRMLASTLFTSDLTGRCDAARSVWNLDPDAPLEWSVGVVAMPPERLRRELNAARRVYLLIINTPEECVIGGDRRHVEEFVHRLGTAFIPLPSVTIAHCELAMPVSAAYRNLHLLPTTPPEGVHFYSGAWGSAYDLNAESAADAILGHALDTVDYPAVIESAYADGVRLFIEVGPGASCSRMIGRILGDRAHLARSACVPHANEVATVLRLLAELHAHRVPLDLAPLYDRPIEAIPAPRPMLKIPVGGKPFEVPTPPFVVESIRVAGAGSSKPRSSGANRGFEDSAPATQSVVSEFRIGGNLVAVQSAIAEAQSVYLHFSESGTQLAARIMAFSNQLLAHAMAIGGADEPVVIAPRPRLDTAQCQEFAVGSIARVLGPEFAAIDAHPTRVRLPDGPLMLVDNIWTIEAEPRSLGAGRVVTDHHVHDQRWYIGEGHIPTSICVEAGQADLFLSGYLGIDFATKGLAVYRLLDAVVTFHRELPRVGEVIRYDIHIDRFFRQGDTHLFRFRFEGTVNGEPLLTMRDGCAGFFTNEELAAGKGIVHTALDRRPIPGKRPDNWRDLAPMNEIESYDADKIDLLRAGDLAGCLGDAFANLSLSEPLTLPGGMLKLVDRVVELDPRGGRYGLGRIRAEMDIRPDDWFLTCHFVDDMVMPGTLMYECCLHTLRVFLLRMGWIGEKARVICEPVPGVASQLKCRGQVIASTKVVTYEVSIKELGYRPEPFVICDALMYADGKPIVEITNMSLRLTGTKREEIERLWEVRSASKDSAPLFDRDRITAFAIGKPSVAFGDRYRVFDAERVIARLPGPPFQFLDRIVDIKNCEPWNLAAGGEIVAEYDVPADEWYFAANRVGAMPFSVLLEIALQPCGWLAAYLGSALTSDVDLAFRNLGGRATQFGPIGPDVGMLTTWVKITRVSRSGGMIIQNYDYRVSAGGRTLYEGDTYFGFFTRAALANQIGLREAKLHEHAGPGRAFAMPTQTPHPDTRLRMLDRIDILAPTGGSKGLGFIRGSKIVNPDEWFFKAHFFQDPVWPGSLGLEAFLQLMKVGAVERWGNPESAGAFSLVSRPHQWTYRGQVIPTDRHVTVEADVVAVDDEARTLTANGFLTVDGRIIYQMSDFTLQG